MLLKDRGGSHALRDKTSTSIVFLNKKALEIKSFLIIKVGVAGFEPTTSTSQMWRDTRLRYTPFASFSKVLNF